MVSEEGVHEGEQMGLIFGRQLLDIVYALQHIFFQ